MKTWVVPVAVTLAYCHAAECPGGSCATPRASLLQLKSLSQKTESLATGSGSSTSAALAGFQKFTDEMIVKYGSDPNTVTANSTELEAVNIIYGFLDEMLSTFDVSHKDAKQKGDECYSFAYHTHCPFDWDTYAQFHGQWQIAQQDHYHCRRDAKVSCEPLQMHCDHYDMYRKFDTRALMPNCIKDGVFGDGWFTAPENELKSNGHGDCMVDSQGNAFQGGWTKGNPLAQCDSDLRIWESNNPSLGDGAKVFDVPGLLVDGSPVKWSEATYEQSLEACKAAGISTETGEYYDQCKTADSLVDAAWTALGCGSANQMDFTKTVSTHTWSQHALVGWNSPAGYDMTAKVASWNSGGTVAPQVANPKCATMTCYPDDPYGPPQTVSDPEWESPVAKCQADWGSSSSICSNSGQWASWGSITGWAQLSSYAYSPLGVTASSWGGSSGVFADIDDHTPFIHTYGEVGVEEPWARVDECRTNVEAEILLAGGTVDYDEATWILMRGADYSASTTDATTRQNIKDVLDKMTNKLTCGDNTFDDSAAIQISDITTCTGDSTTCSDCMCAKKENWNKFKPYCPELPKYNNYDPDPRLSDCSYSGSIDLLETVFPYMDGGISGQCTSTHKLSTGYYYVNPLSGYHKLLKFEQCLDVTFDWLYGEKQVTNQHEQNYVGSSNDGSTTTQQFSGRSLLQELYAEQMQRVGDDVEKYYAKLNGKWTGTSDVRLGAFSASDKIRVTTAYAAAVANCNSPGGSSMRWTRKPGWHKSELKYVAWMEPDGVRTQWGLWQHYVKCELSEQHRAASLFEEGASQGDGSFTGSVERKSSAGGSKSYWARVGEHVKASCDEHELTGGTGCGRTWANASSSSHYTHMASENYTTSSGVEMSRSVSGMTITEHTHCVYINGQCIDQWHIRCLDYYYMCAALQRRAEAAYLEWRFFRENECDAQEKCLTNGADLACDAAHSTVQDNTKKDTQLYKCSETCAIEHENAKARAADVETAERLRCMLEALFGKPSRTIAEGETITDAVWQIPAGSDRSQALVACNEAAYDFQYWQLQQEECPSWENDCTGVARRAYWGVGSDTDALDTGKKWVWVADSNGEGGGNNLLKGQWSEQAGNRRTNCGTKLSARGDLCKTECEAKRLSYDAVKSNSTPSTEFWASWSMIYADCENKHFLTKGLWNTHDVCHLTLFDHDNTEVQITDPRMRQTESANVASTSSTYVSSSSCYGDLCSDDALDEYSVDKTTWGKFAFDFCENNDVLDEDARDVESSGISRGRKALHFLGWDNEATNTDGPTQIFTYAYHSGQPEPLQTWSLYNQNDRDVLCTATHLDESWTPVSNVLAYDGLADLSRADCWRERAQQLVVDDEFGPSTCKIST